MSDELAMSDELLLCKDCRHYWLFSEDDHRCMRLTRRAPQFDLVTGERATTTVDLENILLCYPERTHAGSCGTVGRYWAPATEEAPARPPRPAGMEPKREGLL